MAPSQDEVSCRLHKLTVHRCLAYAAQQSCRLLSHLASLRVAAAVEVAGLTSGTACKRTYQAVSRNCRLDLVMAIVDVLFSPRQWNYKLSLA